jgi:hypothetical protein
VLSEPPALPDLPPHTEIRMSTGVSRERRRLARRSFLRPAVALAVAGAAFVAAGVLRPTDGALLPQAVEELQARLPAATDELDLLQLLVVPFLVIAAIAVLRGARQMRTAARAQLRIRRTGRLQQADGGSEEHVDLDHLLLVDVAPNRALTEINERTPIGSLLVLRLRDATGAQVDVNPGMWQEEGHLLAVIRHYASQGHASITAEAARRYDLPVRDRAGDLHDHAHADDDLRPALEGTPAHGEAQLQAPLRERGIEVQRSAEVQADGLDDE